MIDHININVSDFDGARAFYTQALAPLGVEVIMEFPGTAGLGNEGKPDLWISERDEPSAPIHVAISAPDRERSMPFTLPRSRPAARTTGRPARDLSTTRTTTEPSSSTPTATTSRPSVTARPSSRDAWREAASSRYIERPRWA